MSKREYSGEPIDGRWQTPPWQNDGETLDAYNSDGDGKLMTNDWPEGATDPEELNDKQKKIILTAARYPGVNSPTRLVELSGLDVNASYPQNVLEPHWPERFWGANNAEQDETDIDVEGLRQRLLDGGSLTKLVKEYPASQERLSKLVRGEAEETVVSDIPPLEWLGNSEQRWVIPEEYYNEPVETNHDNDNRSTITEPISELRRRACAGETAQEIAEDHGVADRTIQKRLKGDYGDESEIDHPPLTHNGERWTTEEASDELSEETKQDLDELDQLVNQPKAEPPERDVSVWVWAVFFAVAAWIGSKLFK